MQIHSYVCQVQIRKRIQNIMKYCNERIYKNIKRNCTVIIDTSVVSTNPSAQCSSPSSPALALPRSDRHEVYCTTSAHRLSQTSTCSSYIAHACARTQRAHTHTDAGARASPQTCRQAYKRSGNRDMRAYTMER